MKVNGRVKVQFELDSSAQQGFKTEALWAETLGSNLFRLLNSPFFVFGVSAGDVVTAEEQRGILTFRNVASRGGHSTYRIFLQDSYTIRSEEFLSHWQPIAELGGSFENANDHFVAADVPPSVDVFAVYRALERGEHDEIWSFEEGHYQRNPPFVGQR